ncbi:hypothetical protein G1H11_17725 [Phytoactinopolyspora alkaliphila]|uniref:Type IV secretion system protein n=1 Tax=Phytoactinopolyspora alkaliphila TaxID=1783498 RepID=A0A6N9YQ10_9ACTN|nr:hypothetical protein [Phytoactinopolyspora alkaliphila]NED97141.1 hypothetical protein [Phytoactinopolyspora alkaliphila]
MDTDPALEPEQSSGCHALGDPFSRFVCEHATGGGFDPGGWLHDQTIGKLARAMAEAAETMVTAMWSLIMETTAVDLSQDWIRANVATSMLIALPIVVALYMAQLVSAAWRRQPGELGRAVAGMVGSFSASAIALSVAQSVLLLTDWASDLIMRWRVGVEVGEAIEALTPAMLVAAATGQGAALPAVLIIVFGVLYIVASFTVWFALMARKTLIVVAAVLAPIAFAGLASRWTSGWVMKWVSIMFALAISKITVVMVFAIAASSIRAGLSGTAGSTLRVIGELSMGLMLLAVAAIAPWLTYRFVDFTVPSGREWDGTVGRSAMAARAGAYSARSVMIRTRAATPTGAASMAGARMAMAPVQVVQRQRQQGTR